jgi:hypothetical protein
VDAQRKQCLILFVIYLFEFYLFGFQTILLFMCMNYDFNTLYGSSGAISCHLGAVEGMPLFKNLGRICSNMGLYGLLGRCLGAWLGNRSPHTEIGAPSPPQMA